ncbi:glyoxylase-like metal-dependent hydrolase (beta-lactamase superfamily II) [Saccharothrix ecbatanensis]|uniref:Glyoxylase-like metal-dependent hydrolase (Beta-lactamase superfamily II) n=1 Tax=Saccharothrix ecbatanensis TaxID=1105145 RepID=A0A7W9HIC8_9PSEU|nr:MBL fold metallo-hydrolase [Saccharothrix ecbatanensis]MBB5802877.1 glyoxylase-like metal-dependent hydrolase (beta-lactamase superfamily II) [Saccharothrix ecbatanensis]
MTDGRWTTVADRVHARRYGELDLTVGLVVGDRRCLVIDTRGDVVQGAELAAAVREITALPWTVVYTHAHFDHCFGTTPFLPCDVWAHEGCAAELARSGESARQKRIAKYRAEGKPGIAAALEDTVITPPNRVLRADAELDLGGRSVRLVHPGLAHTDHDVVVHVPDVGVVFAGDTVEHGPHGWTAESFSSDTHITRWPGALDAILALAPRVVVPGHGEPVDVAFVTKHRDGLVRLIGLKNAIAAGEITHSDALAHSPYPQEVSRAVLA